MKESILKRSYEYLMNKYLKFGKLRSEQLEQLIFLAKQVEQ